jgi:hypothetical protein
MMTMMMMMMMMMMMIPSTYHFHASGLIGSPTLPRRRRDCRE